MFRVAENVEDCPAASEAVAETTWPAPSVLNVWDCGQCTGGTPPVHWYVTATLVLFQPFTGGGEKPAVIASGELSVFKAMLVLAVFPALSVAVPL
jgi:hypothetical protein